MRLRNDTPIDPDIADALDAIDATIAGEPVDPRFAELAELALLLAAERPEVDERFARELDAKVARRFAESPPAAAPPDRRRRGWTFLPAAGIGLAAVVAIVAVIAAVPSGHLGGSSASSASSAGVSSSALTHGGVAAPKTMYGAAAAPGHYPRQSAPPRSLSAAAGTVATVTPDESLTQSVSPALHPVPNGRAIIQSAQLALTAAPNRIDAVAQGVYNVVARVNGIVQQSQITQTAGSDGYAQFQLSVPSAQLSTAMSALSQLQYANVTSRTDATQDVNDQYTGLQRKLADARALRTSLLKQLGAATTDQQIESLKAQIRDAEASISADEAALGGLQHQINNSEIDVTINAAPVPVPLHKPHQSGGFTIGKAAHDSVKVLTVAAGVALIALAALLPVGLLAALGWWIGAAVRRRRREQALDLA